MTHFGDIYFFINILGTSGSKYTLFRQQSNDFVSFKIRDTLRNRRETSTFSSACIMFSF